MEARLRQALPRAEEVERQLADPAVARDPAQLQALGPGARAARRRRAAGRAARAPGERAGAGSGARRRGGSRARRAGPGRPRAAARPRSTPLSRGAARAARARATRTTIATPSWRSGPAPAATRRRCSPPTSTACTSASPSATGLRWEPMSLSDGTLGGHQGGDRRGPRARRPTACCGGSRACTGYSACPRPRRRAAFTPPPRPWPCCPRRRRWT